MMQWLLEDILGSSIVQLDNVLTSMKSCMDIMSNQICQWLLESQLQL